MHCQPSLLEKNSENGPCKPKLQDPSQSFQEQDPIMQKWTVQKDSLEGCSARRSDDSLTQVITSGFKVMTSHALVSPGCRLSHCVRNGPDRSIASPPRLVPECLPVGRQLLRRPFKPSRAQSRSRRLGDHRLHDGELAVELKHIRRRLRPHMKGLQEGS